MRCALQCEHYCSKGRKARGLMDRKYGRIFDSISINLIAQAWCTYILKKKLSWHCGQAAHGFPFFRARVRMSEDLLFRPELSRNFLGVVFIFQFM